MKTSIKQLFAAVLILVSLSSTAFASTDANPQITILNQVKNIRKIVASGNVEVILVQAAVESVKVYDNYYAKNSLVQQEEGVLRISSFQKKPLTVIVYVRDLSVIEANDNAIVRTVGKAHFLSLDVILKDNAQADINAVTVNLNTLISDHAQLKLSGATTDHVATLSSSAAMNMDQFAAANTSVHTLTQVYAKAKTKKAANLPANDDLFLLSK